MRSPAAGVTSEQVRAAFGKMRGGGTLTPAEQALLAQLRGQFQQSSPGGGTTGSYIVFARRGGRIAPVPIQTGLTDQDYIEVTGGVTKGDTVLVLSSGPTRERCCWAGSSWWPWRAGGRTR